MSEVLSFWQTIGFFFFLREFSASLLGMLNFDGRWDKIFKARRQGRPRKRVRGVHEIG